MSGSLRVHNVQRRRLISLVRSGSISEAQAAKELRVLARDLLQMSQRPRGNQEHGGAAAKQSIARVEDMARKMLKKAIVYDPLDVHTLQSLAVLYSTDGSKPNASAAVNFANFGLQAVSQRLAVLLAIEHKARSKFLQLQKFFRMLGNREVNHRHSQVM